MKYFSTVIMNSITYFWEYFTTNRTNQLLEGRLFDFTLQCEIAQRFPCGLLLTEVVIRVSPGRVHMLLASVAVGRHGLIRSMSWTLRLVCVCSVVRAWRFFLKLKKNWIYLKNYLFLISTSFLPFENIIHPVLTPILCSINNNFN